MRGLCRTDFTSSTSLWFTLAIGTGSGITRCLSVSYARQQMKPGLVRMCRCLPVPCITCASCKNGCCLLDFNTPGDEPLHACKLSWQVVFSSPLEGRCV